MTVPEPLTPEDTTIVMIDYAVDFANLLRSHDLGTPINTSSDWPSGRYEAGVTGPRRRLSAQPRNVAGGCFPASESRNQSWNSESISPNGSPCSSSGIQALPRPSAEARLSGRAPARSALQ